MAFISTYGSYSDANPVQGTGSDDTLIVRGGSEITVEGNRGNDTIKLYGGEEHYVNGGAGDDNIEIDNVSNAAMYSTVNGGSGNDKIDIYNTYVKATGGDGNDTFYLATLFNELNHVTLTGGSGSDVFRIAPSYRGDLWSSTKSIRKVDFVITDLSSDDVIRNDLEDSGELTYSKSGNNIVLQDEGPNSFNVTLQGVTDISQVADVTYRTKSGSSTLKELLNIGGKTDTYSGGGDDTYSGGGDDTYSGGGDDTYSGDGDDTYDDDEDDTYSGSEEEYSFSFNDDETSVELFEDYEGTFDASDYADLKTIDGSAVTSDIEIYGNDQKNSIVGGSGADTLYGGSGNDTLKGGGGKDVFAYSEGDGNDVITDYTAGKDKINIQSGSIKKVSLSGSNVILSIGSGKITVKNAKGKKITIVDENEKTFTTVVSASATTSGSNKVTLSNTNDSIFTAASTTVTINASKRSKAIHITGNAKANKILGGSAKDTIYGGAGNDSIKGNAGNDKLFGDAGNDTLYGGAGADILSGGAGNDKLFGDAGNDSLAGGAGVDTLNGGAGNDTLTGGAGKDVFLFDGKGKDIITDYTAAQDKIIFTSEDVSMASVKGSDVIFVLESGNIIVKKGKNKNITIVDTNGDETTAKYTKTTYFDYSEDAEDEEDGEDYEVSFYEEEPWFAKDNNFTATDEVDSILDNATKNISIEQTSSTATLTDNLVQFADDLTTTSFSASKKQNNI